MTNLNLLFNKTYYNRLNQPDFEESLIRINQQIFDTVFHHETDYRALEFEVQTVILQTVYPGLLIGTGNAHGSLTNIKDINAGFSFDYVTGQPFIQGSTVKGALRTYFKNHPDAVLEILRMQGVTRELNIKALEQEIFTADDVFLDAVLYAGDDTDHIVGSEFIVPHSEKHKSPMPLYYIKVLPNVRFEFRFDLTDGILTKEEKTALFSFMLQNFGIGAKSNTGYGFFVEGNRELRPAVNLQEAVVCPCCGIENHKYYDDGNLRRRCYKCQKFLYDKSEWEGLQ